MPAKVVAIGLDCGDAERVTEWMCRGRLEALGSIRAQGAWCQLDVKSHYRDEALWTEVLCGCRAEKTGFFSPLSLREGTYDFQSRPVYDFQEYPVFYGLDPGRKIAAFDVPHCTSVAGGINGIQVLSWGAHYPHDHKVSFPENLLGELIEAYGPHPAIDLMLAGGGWWDKVFLETLFDALLTGIARRGAICKDLLRRDSWDLFFTVAMETHEACHHFESPDHPCSPTNKTSGRIPEDPMLKLYEALDRELLSHVLADLEPDTYLLVFSVTGSTANCQDIANAVILPEFLYRLSFPGRSMFPASSSAPVPPEDCPTVGMPTWAAEMWNRRTDSRLAALFMNPFGARSSNRLANGQLRRERNVVAEFGSRMFNGISRRLASRFVRFEYGPHSWIPASWYKLYWPAMKAFALPSTEAGRIRINLKGREPHGLVEPLAYDSVCEELTARLKELSDPRTGTRVVKEVIKWKRASRAKRLHVPDEDLTVVWNEAPLDVAESPEVGRIGPFPFCRLGGHSPGGFLIIRGPGIQPGSTWPQGEVLDLAPTILSLMGVRVPDYFDGKSLFKQT